MQALIPNPKRQADEKMPKLPEDYTLTQKLQVAIATGNHVWHRTK